MRYFLFLYCTFCISANSQVIVTKVIDGDTFIIDTGEKVRLIGVDCPELKKNNKLKKDIKRTGKDYDLFKYFGIKAYEYTKNSLLNKVVIMKIDTINNDKDRYGRLLRYVYVNDTILFNLSIINDGYAFAYTKYAFLYQKEFIEAEEKACLFKTGLWVEKDFQYVK